MSSPSSHMEHVKNFARVDIEKRNADDDSYDAAEDGLLDPAQIADTYWHVAHQQLGFAMSWRALSDFWEVWMLWTSVPARRPE